MLVIFIGKRCILYRYHDFIQLLAGTDSDFTGCNTRTHCFCQILYMERRNLADEGLSALCFCQGFQYQLHTLRKRDPETCHTIIGYRKLFFSLIDQFLEERNNGSAAACHIAVTDDGEVDVLGARICIGCDEQLIRYHLGRTVQVHRIDCLICRKRHYSLYAAVE